MQHSSLTWPNSRTKYYNPISKIRSLIQNLDAELVQICNQCALPRTSVKLGADNSSDKSFNRSPTSMLAANNDPLGGVQTRTLSSIYRAKVIDAYRNRRIFTVYGNYHTLRRALLRRGWLEKLTPCRYPRLQNLPEDALLQQAKRGNEYEAVAISKIINHFPAFFIWQPKSHRDQYADVLPHRNRVRRGRNLDFSTKVGLIGCAEQEPWYRQDGVAGMKYPRFYRLTNSIDEKASFIEDFQQTQCRSLLKFLAENVEHPEEIANEDDGIIPPSVATFALAQVKKQVGDCEHINLDDKSVAPADSERVEWETFMAQSTEVLHKRGRIKVSISEILDLIKVSKSLIEKLEVKYPDYKWDGFRNLWILKPGYQCRGLGIIIRSNLEDILQWTTNNSNRRYIAQKYIERPLLVYRTKFDIRQYMLLCIGEVSVSIWLYKDCYLRFSSQEFSIDDLRESIHLTNNSVQKKYRNKPNRDPRLPKSNMWSLEQFKIYLKHHNAPDDIWNRKIYAGFKENLISVVLASLEETEFVENAFELYGCDFMLDEEYNPILIEINSTPDLSPSTEVTARICPMALNDLVKVIVDLPRNTRASTGEFEMVYEVNYKIKSDFMPATALDIKGTSMKLLKPLMGRSPKPRFSKKSLIKSTKQTEEKNKQKKTTPVRKVIVVKPRRAESITSNKAAKKPLQASTKEALALRYAHPK